MIGRELLPLLVAAGHEVAGMTRTAGRLDHLSAQGAVPVLCDVYDAEALEQAVLAFRPDLVMHQLTDLPDDPARLADFAARNNRVRTEGTRNLLSAAQRAGARQVIAQSIAWTPPTGGEAVAEHERLVLEAGGVVLRYGAFYGPGTYYQTTPLPPPPRIEVGEAARRTVELLSHPAGIVELVEDSQK